MNDEKFRELLNRAKKGTTSEKEEELLDRLLAAKDSSTTVDAKTLENSKQKVQRNTLIAIRFMKKRIAYRKVFRYAASFLLFLSIGFGIYKFSSFEKDIETNTVFVEISTNKGERKTIYLPDSSTIHLNASSYCRYPENFPYKERLIELKGEAYFQVKRNEQKPFKVKSSGITTTVLGTSFNIREDSSSFTVTVSTGRVLVEKENFKKPVYLNKNEQLKYNALTEKITLSHIDAEKVCDWSRGIIAFNDNTFDEAILKLEEWYNVTIQCNSAELLQRTITGNYHNKSIEYVLNDMEFMLDFEYEKNGDMIIINP
jgi:transmembrane sensor